MEGCRMGRTEHTFWAITTRIIQSLSFGLLDEVTEQDAKGYVKCLTSFTAILILAGLMEGGAL